MPRPWTRLEQSLLMLNGYLHPRFGARNLPELAEELKTLPEGYDVTGRSYVAQRLLLLPALKIPRADLESYDDNIQRHLERINRARPVRERIVLKYFQQLSLLYTEHILQRFFLDQPALQTDLNAVVVQWNQDMRNPADHFPPVNANDLTKLAYWMATGSGKTLLLHINYHQFLHYHAAAGGKRLNSILLITPNAGLSEQHLRDFAASGIPAQRFRSASSASLEANTVQVLEITKLTERGAGPLTVHVEKLEGNNLVFVDEGHRGASDDNLRPTILADGRAGYVVKVSHNKPDLVAAVQALVETGNHLYQQDLGDLPNVYFDRHLYQPLLAAGVYDGESFTLSPDIKTVPVALNRGEARFPWQLRTFLRENPTYLGHRRLYLLRNLSRGKGIGFFAADDFYPDYILWLVADDRQRIVFVDPKGLAMLKPNDFTHPKIQLYQTLAAIADDLGDPKISLDSFIVSDKSFVKTKPDFGTSEHSRDEFHRHQILFPEDSLAVLLGAVI